MEEECNISDYEDKNESDWGSVNYESSSDNDDCSGDEHQSHFFDPTKITTSLPLLPFHNQVGGHASFFRFSKKAICKPVSSKEQAFYEYIEAKHPELLPFTSQYMGVLNVTYRSAKSASGDDGESLVPEVLFEKNKHLLRYWRACHDGAAGKRRRHGPHRASSLMGTRTKRNSPEADLSSEASSMRFPERVLREVFSPEALQERLRQAKDWQRRGRCHPSDSSFTPVATPNSADSSFPLVGEKSSASSLRRTWDDSLLTQGGRSAPETTFRTTSSSLFPTRFSASFHPLSAERRRTPTRTTLATEKTQYDTPERGWPMEDEDEIFPMDDLPAMRTDSVSGPVPVLKVNSALLSSGTSTTANATMAENGPEWELQSMPDNPWSLQIQNRSLQKVRNHRHTSKDEPVKQFILIEDLTDGVKYPCVLDLKMGTRQYGVDATQAKMRSQTIKCENSTSKALGVRVCGMQVYKADTGNFVFQDKYYGRTLNPESFRDTLVAFLDNGHGCQLHHIPPIIRKLRRLASIIKTMEDYRFYASSLLVIYDGDPTSTRKIDLRIIDFARCVTREDMRSHYASFTYPPRHKGSDYGYLLGLKTLVNCFEWIYKTYGGLYEELKPEDNVVFDDIVDPGSQDAYATFT